MTAEPVATLLEERRRLQEEVRTLTAQVKLLVKAEHGLTRSRREIDHQLGRIQLLAELSSRANGADEPWQVLTNAQRVLKSSFELDDVRALVTLHPGSVVHEAASCRVDDATAAALASLESGVANGDEPVPTMLCSLLTHLGLIAAGATPTRVIWVPVRTADTKLYAVLVGYTSKVRAYHRELPQPAHLSFLELLASHLSRALDNVGLNAQLRHQGAALAETNQHLKKSLEELERTQAQLVQAQKLEALGRLAGGIAHDFNNLLTVILTHAEFLRERFSGDPVAAEDANVIVETTTRATEITRRLLAFGRKQENRQGQIDLNALTMDLSRLLRRLIGDEVMLQLDLDPSLARVAADAVQLEQILMNLVVNARDAMPRGGRLTIETRWAKPGDGPEGVPLASGMVAWRVIDEGIGMDEATRKQLFEPFFTTKPVGKGTGLGLATVYGLVTQNRGLIKVDSAPGQGTRFSVLLPTVEQPVTTLPVAANVRGRVMVVEDEDPIRRVICRMLRSKGFEVREARDGQEALETISKAGPVDLVVTDVMMPMMTGPEMVKRLRESWPALKVIFVSGHTFDALTIDRLEPELESFLPKPFSPAQLSAAVDRFTLPNTH